ncbi:873_t:CDS:1, partial [Dentiscutata erythropus]
FRFATPLQTSPLRIRGRFIPLVCSNGLGWEEHPVSDMRSIVYYEVFLIKACDSDRGRAMYLIYTVDKRTLLTKFYFLSHEEKSDCEFTQ